MLISHSTFCPFKKAAYFFPMGVDPFVDFEQVLFQALQSEYEANEENEPSAEG